VENVRKVMEGVRRWRSVGMRLLVPEAILNKIAVECSSDDERISALASYVVTTLPVSHGRTLLLYFTEWMKRKQWRE